MAGNKKRRKVPTNLKLSERVKNPSIELAAQFDWSLSEYVERLLEAQLIQHKKLRERLFPVELAPPPARPAKQTKREPAHA